MTRTDMLAVVLAPLVGGLLWWLFFRAAKFGHDYLWRRLPEGRLRRMLLKRVD